MHGAATNLVMALGRGNADAGNKVQSGKIRSSSGPQRLNCEAMSDVPVSTFAAGVSAAAW